jgi:hypothetical protein
MRIEYSLPKRSWKGNKESNKTILEYEKTIQACGINQELFSSIKLKTRKASAIYSISPVIQRNDVSLLEGKKELLVEEQIVCILDF